MTNTTFDKSIRYDHGDYRAELDGNYIGHFATYHDAEVALDQVAYDLLMDGQCATAAELDGGSDADAMAEEVAAAVLPETAMVSIVEPGLVDANIQVWPHSTVELVERQPTANIWYALLVDGRYHNLVMKKHTIGRDYLMQALDRALASVQAAIEALNPQADAPAKPAAPACEYCDDTGLVPNGSGTGDQSGGWADTCECQDESDDYGDALAEGAMGSYNGRTTIDPPVDTPTPSPLPPPWERPRVLRVNLPRTLGRELCQKLGEWRRQSGRPLGFSGVIAGDYTRLYLSTNGVDFPHSLISLVLRHIRHHRGTAAICGAWLLTLEVGQVVTERELLDEVA